MSTSFNGSKTTINMDLGKERKNCSFNITELTNHLDGGVEATQKRKEQENFYLDDAELMGGVPLEYLSHKEKYEEVVRKIRVLRKKLGPHRIYEYGNVVGGNIENAIFKDATPLSVHFSMFMHAIKSQGTEDQQKQWLPLATDCQILGTYAQTELGHGTFIRGLETTATYDPKTEEFVLNSPTLTSLKWWPASLGNTSNHAATLAQLYSMGKCHGVHMFLAQLRDAETHQPLPGITIGDVGPRLGMSGTNNGYLGFKNVRIPRNNMLMKNAQILKDGTYVPPLNIKLTYGSMVLIRVAVVWMAANSLKKGVTIAVRYSAVRRQSQLKPGSPECQIIDYVTQQHKLFPHIAACFAYVYAAQWLKELYTQVTMELQDGNLNQLEELHSLSSCLKAIASSDATEGVEACRMACGGHGYMMCSGFPILYGITTPMCTYEGENTVLLLQTARSLMKAWSKMLEGRPLAPIVQYFVSARDGKEVPYNRSIDWIVWALERISVRKIEHAWNHMHFKIEQGLAPDEAWNLASVQLVAAAEAYARTFVVKTYRDMTSKSVATMSQPLTEVLEQLLDLYGVHVALKLHADILKYTGVSSSVLDNLQHWLVELLQDIRPNAVGIVDSFDLRDEILGSALGAYDGDVYQRLFKEAKNSPLNSEPVNQSFENYLKPFLMSKY